MSQQVPSVSSLAVLPAGAWGTALAIKAAARVPDVRLWHPRPERVAGILRTRENRTSLPGAQLPRSVTVTSDLAEAVTAAGAVILAPPSRSFAELCRKLAPGLEVADRPWILSATKGLEECGGRRMSQVATDILPPHLIRGIAAISGPNFAAEVAADQPTSTVVAAADPAAALVFQTLLHGPTFRVYTSGDLTGVEIAGAVKNVLALGVGMTVGMGLGHNTAAALITRGLAEMTRLGTAMGAHVLTFTGLAGLGDLVLTCTGEQSRNRRAGILLGRGGSLDEVVPAVGTVEGVATTAAACRLAADLGVETPITRQIHAILFEGRNPADALRQLMTRERGHELKGVHGLMLEVTDHD